MIEQGCAKLSGAGASMAEETAFHLYQIAALMLGDEREAVSLVEETVASVEADPCADGAVAHDEAISRLIAAAVGRMGRLQPGAFAASTTKEETGTCIDPDEVDPAAISSEQIAALMETPARAKLREWLEGLAPALRVIFVLRAVLRRTGEQTAESLRESGATGTASWGTRGVESAYRQALCSLATSLLSATSAAPV